jgi:hypothetical protein
MPKPKPKKGTKPSATTSIPVKDVQGACERAWEMLHESLLEACRDGSLAARPEAGPEHAAALLAVLEGHPDIAGGLFRAGFMAALELAMDAMNAMADQAALLAATGQGGCPIHGTAGCHQQVGRA